MKVLRRCAVRLLRWAVRRSSVDGQSWGDAMLAELDFIESDSAAFRWALGSASALLRRTVAQQVKARLEKGFGATNLKDLGRKAAGILSGVVFACGVLAICTFILFFVFPRLFPGQQMDRKPLVELLTMIVIPEAVFIAAAVVFWRRKRPVATGLLLAGMIFIVHVVIHVATR